MATYQSEEHIRHAQAMLEQHAVSIADGLCVTCGVLGPCAEHEAAATVFKTSRRLPRRPPGATRPELVGARRVGERGLLARAG